MTRSQGKFPSGYYWPILAHKYNVTFKVCQYTRWSISPQVIFQGLTSGTPEISKVPIDASHPQVVSGNFKNVDCHYVLLIYETTVCVKIFINEAKPISP
jgi:hypothetical protein